MPKPTEKINLVLFQTTSTYNIQWAMENNYVKFPDNVDVKFVSSAVSNDIFITGQADIGTVSTPSFLIAWNMSKDWMILYPSGTVYTAIATYKDSNISSLKDLKGKTIAMSGLKFTTTILLLDILQKKYNISSNEITLISKPWAEIPSLIEKKDVDAGLVTQLNLEDINKLNLSVIVDLNKGSTELYGAPIITTVIAAKKNIDIGTAKEIIDSLNNANEIALEHSDEVIKSYYEKYDVNASASFNYMKITKFKLVEPWNENNKATLQKEFELSREYGAVEKIPNLEDVIMKLGG